MADLDIVAQDADRFRVTVTEGSSRTTHDVTTPSSYVEQLGLSGVDRSKLVEESFRFLLEREPKESIMRSFDLAVIARYFPEYPDDIARRMST